MYENTHICDICMAYSKFLKSLPGRFSDFYFLFLTIHIGTKHFPECLNFTSQENYERFSLGKTSPKYLDY